MLTVASTARRAGTGRSSVRSMIPSVTSVSVAVATAERDGRCARRAPRRSPSARSGDSRTTAPRTWRATPLEPRLASAGRSARTRRRPGTGSRGASGQSSHRGVGRQNRRDPRSIIAWFQSPGADGSSHACASLDKSARRNLVRLSSVDGSRDDPADVGVERGHRLAVADRRDRGRRVRTDAGQSDGARPRSRGTRPPWSRTIARAASWSATARRL